MRVCVAEILVETLKSLGLRYPTVDEHTSARFEKIRRRLEREVEAEE